MYKYSQECWTIEEIHTLVKRLLEDKCKVHIKRRDTDRQRTDNAWIVEWTADPVLCSKRR